MAMNPFDRLWPIQRSTRSFFEPNMEVGQWTDFHRDMWSRMRDMERQMDTMYRDFQQLTPTPMSPSTAMVSPFTFGRQLSTEQENQRMENPFVTDKDGNRKLQLQYDVHQFKPEEIQVKTHDRQLSVHARHESKTDSSQVCQEYSRQFTLPEGLEPENLSSVLSPEGILIISAPMPAIEAPPKELKIAIEHKK